MAEEVTEAPEIQTYVVLITTTKDGVNGDRTLEGVVGWDIGGNSPAGWVKIWTMDHTYLYPDGVVVEVIVPNVKPVGDAVEVEEQDQAVEGEGEAGDDQYPFVE